MRLEGREKMERRIRSAQYGTCEILKAVQKIFVGASKKE
jgi:hypothetical protein